MSPPSAAAQQDVWLTDVEPHVDDAPARLARILRIDAEAAELLVAAKPVPIRRNVDATTAEQYVAALTGLGLVAERRATTRGPREGTAKAVAPAAPAPGTAGETAAATPPPTSAPAPHQSRFDIGVAPTQHGMIAEPLPEFPLPDLDALAPSPPPTTTGGGDAFPDLAPPPSGGALVEPTSTDVLPFELPAAPEQAPALELAPLIEMPPPSPGASPSASLPPADVDLMPLPKFPSLAPPEADEDPLLTATPLVPSYRSPPGPPAATASDAAAVPPMAPPGPGLPKEPRRSTPGDAGDSPKKLRYGRAGEAGEKDIKLLELRVTPPGLGGTALGLGLAAAALVARHRAGMSSFGGFRTHTSMMIDGALIAVALFMVIRLGERALQTRMSYEVRRAIKWLFVVAALGLPWILGPGEGSASGPQGVLAAPLHPSTTESAGAVAKELVAAAGRADSDTFVGLLLGDGERGDAPDSKAPKILRELGWYRMMRHRDHARFLQMYGSLASAFDEKQTAEADDRLRADWDSATPEPWTVYVRHPALPSEVEVSVVRHGGRFRPIDFALKP